MRNFQDTFETRKRSFINPFSFCMTVPLTYHLLLIRTSSRSNEYIGILRLKPANLLVLKIEAYDSNSCSPYKE